MAHQNVVALCVACNCLFEGSQTMNRDSSYVDRQRGLAQKDWGACRSCGAADRSSCRSLFYGTHSIPLGTCKALRALF